MGSYCSVGTEFQFFEMRRVLWVGGGDCSKQCEYNLCDRTVRLKMVNVENFILCILP